VEIEVFRKEYGKFLEDYPWLWFCSLTFRPGLKQFQAEGRLLRWLGELDAALGAPNFGYFAVLEYGRTGMDLHYHVLVKGLTRSHFDEKLEWMRRWHELAGDALITPFNPDAGGVAYILKNLDPNRPDHILFKLDSGDQMQQELGQSDGSSE
jgi:hypothetical protein